MISWGCFETAAPKKNEIIQRNLCYSLMLLPSNTNAQVQSTAYYRTKNVTADDFLKVLKRKRCTKSLKISKKSLQNCSFPPNVTGLQFTISYVSKNRLQGKCFLWVFSNSWTFIRKKSTMKSGQDYLQNLNAS